MNGVANMEAEYSNRELDRMFKEISESLERIEEQTTKTNGRVTRLEKILMIVAAVGSAIAVIKFPELLNAIKIFI